MSLITKKKETLDMNFMHESMHNTSLLFLFPRGLSRLKEWRLRHNALLFIFFHDFLLLQLHISVHRWLQVLREYSLFGAEGQDVEVALLAEVDELRQEVYLEEGLAEILG